METSTMNSICRCCATEGVFKYVTLAYTWMGEEEIYADMLKECFDISLNLSDSSEEAGICEVCITQLRNASNFKKQVLSTEEQLKKHAQNRLFKPNIVKVEVTRDDDEDDTEDNMSGDETYSGPEFEVPIKTESDETKKRTMATRATTSGLKKSKSDAGESSTKRLPAGIGRNIKKEDSFIDIEIETVTADPLEEMPEKSIKKAVELKRHKINLKEVLRCSNATPIGRCVDMGYKCCFCYELFKEPANLKKHTVEKHPDYTDITYERKFNTDKHFIKLDITGLLCTICTQDFDSIELLLQHLKSEHQKRVYIDLKNHMIPFKFDSDTLQCCICSKPYNKFKILQEHMHTHYRNYICEVCGSGYFNKHSLKSHKTNSHVKGAFKCEFCTKTFDTNKKKGEHERITHSKQHRFRCGFCKETFKNLFHKEEHLVNLHGLKIATPECKSCGKVFCNRKKLQSHIKRIHLLDKPNKCSECDMAFHTRKELADHMVKHTGLKTHECIICMKLFSRESTLKEHMKIHDDVRRFECEHCGQAFIQKCSWKGHLKSKHGYEFV